MANCVRCGAKMFSLLGNGIKEGPLCKDCLKKLKADYLAPGRMNLWTLEDLGEYEYYLAKMELLKQRFNPETIYEVFETSTGQGVRYDWENRILHFTGPDIWIDARKLLVGECIPEKSKPLLYQYELASESWASDKHSGFKLIFGFIDSYFPVLSFKFTSTKWGPVFVHKGIRDDIYPLRPDRSEAIQKAIAMIANASMASYGMDLSFEDAEGKMSIDEREAARAHFRQERIGMLCYMHKKGLMCDERFQELLWTATKNVEALGWIYLKYKDYNPYCRTDEMKAYGSKYCGEVEQTLPISSRETGKVLTDEEVEQFLDAHAVVPEAKLKKRVKEHDLDPEDERDFARSNYLRALVFAPNEHVSKHMFVDQLKGLICFSTKDTKIRMGDCRSDLEIYRIRDIIGYRQYNECVSVTSHNSETGEPYVSGEVWVEITFSTKYHSGHAHYMIYQGMFVTEMTKGRILGPDEYETHAVEGTIAKNLFEGTYTHEGKVEEKEPYRDYSTFYSAGDAASFIIDRVYRPDDYGKPDPDFPAPEWVDNITPEERAAIDEYRNEFAEHCRGLKVDKATNMDVAKETAANMGNLVKGIFGRRK